MYRERDGQMDGWVYLYLSIYSCSDSFTAAEAPPPPTQRSAGF